MRREAGQMSRWYEGIREESSNIIYSRIRLARNWDEYVFPSRLSEPHSSGEEWSRRPIFIRG